jgi:hypothetical protein
MNRPRLVGILSAVIGSTAGFLVLHRWRLAGTITGAAAMPVIYALVTHCSHASLEGLRKGVRRFAHRGNSIGAAEATDGGAGSAGSDSASTQDVSVARSARPAGRGLQWSDATLAFLAFAASVYSLSQSGPGTTILRERVVETVTVTTERSALSNAKSAASAATVAGLSEAQDSSTTTTALAGDPSDTTVSTDAGLGSTTTSLVQ